jgi:hypothetical protein
MSEGIGDGIDQHLCGEFDAGITAGDGARCREIAARAVAGYSKPVRIAAELCEAACDIAHGGKGVLEGAWKPHLGRPSIIHGDDHGAGLDCEIARLSIMGLEVARDPAATVEKTTVGDVASDAR